MHMFNLKLMPLASIGTKSPVWEQSRALTRTTNAICHDYILKLCNVMETLIVQELFKRISLAVV